ncbi:MAG: hypothetical protein MR038_05335 [Oscillospiraceae bacterium]|nr:hypothetical protein [Oscillospiraceae bacterium]
MFDIDLSGYTGLKITPEGKKAGELFRSKLEEYKEHFGELECPFFAVYYNFYLRV